MVNILKKIWLVLFVFMIFGLLALVPIEKPQRAYMQGIKELNEIPQKRVNHNYKYVEYIEEGNTPIQFEDFHKILTEYEKFLQRKSQSRTSKNPRKRKPYFIRDKNNPKILYPYKDR